MRSKPSVLSAIALITVLAVEARAQAPEAEATQEKKADRYEPGILPAINFDSDIGVGFGVVGALAHFTESPAHNPYHWRLELQVFAAGKTGPDGKFGIPFQSHYLDFDWVGLFDGKFRLNARGFFRKFSNSGYYGLGNRSVRETFTDAQLEANEALRRFHTYDRIYPGLILNGRWNLYEEKVKKGKRRLELLFGITTQYSITEVYSGSRLEQDILQSRTDTEDGRTLRRLILGVEDHPTLYLNLGLLWDTRDHEFTPSRGTFTELAVRFSPGVSQDLLFAGFYLESSWFGSLIEDYLVIGARGAADVMVGKVPFYEMSRYGVRLPKDGTGGGRGLRGTLLQRHHGKVKLMLNLELRGMFPAFEVFGQRIRLGLVALTDTGRVWADTSATTLAGRDLDGPFSEFQVGIGGGLRVQWGQTFIIRADGAYAPTDSSSGIYITLGQLF